MDPKKAQRIHGDTWLIGVWIGRLFTMVVLLCASAVVVALAYTLIRLLLGVCHG